jgi:hypothetical protein
MYTSQSYEGVIYVAIPSLKGGKYLWYTLEGSGAPERVAVQLVPFSVRKLAYNQFWKRGKG